MRGRDLDAGTAVQTQQTSRERAIIFAINLLATVQVVYFFVIRVPSYLVLDAYEHGRERMPFQARLLMRYPLLWASHSGLLTRAANLLTASTMWLPRPVKPEDIVEIVIGIAAVAFAGLVARGLYRRHSPHARLLNYVYPVFLVMVTVTYCLLTTDFYRYVYDLPALGLFAAGVYLIYGQDQPWLFAGVFVVATLNRETSVFLLPLLLQHRCMRDWKVDWSCLLRLRTGGLVAGLLLFWLGFRLWAKLHFSMAPAADTPGVVSNLTGLLWLYAWPQYAAIGAYVLPLLLLYRRSLSPTVCRSFAWMWMLPPWAALMFVYGNIVEVRLFGEFLPLLCCTAMLVAEERLFGPTLASN